MADDAGDNWKRLFLEAAEFLEEREWHYDAERCVTECLECGASFRKWQPLEHKPDCALKRLLDAAKADTEAP